MVDLEVRQLEHRIMRAIAMGGICYGGVFLISSVQRGWFSSLSSVSFRDLRDWLEFVFTAGFSLLLAASIGLFGCKAWGRKGFIIAVAMITVGIAGSRIQQFVEFAYRFAATQPSPPLISVSQHAWNSLSSLIEELIMPAVAIWILCMPEIARATRMPALGGFDVVQRSRREA